MGTWEYLPAAKSLLINRIEETILLNQNFVDASVMVLRLDGQQHENLIMANEVLLPDLDVVGYLKSTYIHRINSSTFTEPELKKAKTCSKEEWPITRIVATILFVTGLIAMLIIECSNK